MCQVLRVSPSGYYDWRGRPEATNRSLRRKELLDAIIIVYEESGRRYGSPRITHALWQKGILCNEKTIAKVMSEEGIVGRHKKRFRRTTDSSKTKRIEDNELNRDFVASKPNEKWVSDITYISTVQGFLYLCVVIDLFSRKVVGWCLDDHMEASLVAGALQNALRSTGAAILPGLLFHSDRGSQYASDEVRHMLENYQLKPSMSRKGNCWDNAVAESFFSSLKIEELFRGSVPERDEVRSRVFDYIECFYNRVRLHSTLEYHSPEKFLENYYKEQIAA